MKYKHNNIVQILEAALFAAGEPLSVERLGLMFEENRRPSNQELREVLAKIADFYSDRGVKLIEVASGYRFQSRVDYSPWLKKLWEKKPPRYSRALLETLALVIYRQPITRGEIEDVRGVAVSSNIMKILVEREWVKVVGQKDVPGKPSLYATTKQFLDYFCLKSLSDLPPLDEVVNFEELEQKLGEQLNLEMTQPSANDDQVAGQGEVEAASSEELFADDEELIEVSAEDELAAMQLVDSIERSLAPEDDSIEPEDSADSCDDTVTLEESVPESESTELTEKHVVVD